METVSDAAKRSVKYRYAFLCCAYLIVAGGLWTGIRYAIKFAEGKTAYFAGACAAASLVTICFLLTVRIYINVMSVGRSPERNQQISNMFTLQVFVSLLALMGSFAGIIISGVLGISYCFGYKIHRWSDQERCVNVEENRDIAKGLMAGCGASVLLHFIAIATCNANMIKLGLARSRRATIPTPIEIQQMYMYQQWQINNMQMAQNPSTNPYAMPQLPPNISTMPPPPTDPSVNPYPMPHLPSNYSTMPPPPDYLSTVGQGPQFRR